MSSGFFFGKLRGSDPIEMTIENSQNTKQLLTTPTDDKSAMKLGSVRFARRVARARIRRYQRYQL